jgi:acyl transferase domain-containing protein/acyl-CoA synthetase (AMP-forming)/AMP-acid ligase II/acyl carrier protein
LNTPNETALIFLDNGERESLRLTFKEVDEKARCIALQLATITKPGDRALLLYPSSVEFPCAFLGCLYAGVVAVPAYPPRRNRSMDRLQAIVTDAGARVALTTGATLVDLEKRGAGLPGLEELQFVATDKDNGFDPAGWNAPLIEPGALAFLQYTSGSTGLPKGVMVSHGNIIANMAVVNAASQSAGLPKRLILVSWLPLFHDMGLIGSLMWPLIEGGTLVSMEPAAFIQKPVRWLQAISRYRANLAPAPNSAFELCVRKVSEQQKEGVDLSCWRIAFNGSEPVHEETIEGFAAGFRSCGFRPEVMYPCYGLAETTLFVTGGVTGQPPVRASFDGLALEQRFAVPPVNPERAVIKVGSGRTWDGHRVRIVDPDTRRACAEDQVGEIWVSGPSVAQGYWNRPELSEATFQARIEGGNEPFLRTGDLGFLKGDDLFVSGRLKDLIIINGLNHYPQDIERTLERCHAALAPNASATFSVDVHSEERLVAVCEIQREHLRRLNQDELVACIRQAVAEEHELDLHAVLFIKPFGMPRTSSGKIKRHACRAAFLAGAGLDVVAQWRNSARAEPAIEITSSGEPRAKASIQRWLIDRVAAKLGIAPTAVRVREPFTRYGLESRDAIAISGELQEWLGCSLMPTLIYDYPNIEALAEHLVHEGSAPERLVRSISHANGNGKIAIIGLGCRFPGADSPENYWKLLAEGVDAIRSAPRRDGLSSSAYDNAAGVSWGGYLDHVDLFEPEFFGISRREAELMDPQQRLLAEVAWEALEYAGISPQALAGSNTAVAIGISNLDYSRLRPTGSLATDPYVATGNALSIAANRISYLLDLRGPSWAVDTACSSSLVAVHQACRSLLAMECNLALAGGVNLIMTQQLTTVFSNAGMLSTDGRCKTFDDDANGYVRGEGAGMIVLKRLEDAERDADNILAIIRGSAVNQDGRSNGLTAPNGPSQQAAIRQALSVAAVSPHEISYVEAHGTGTPLGDPIEMNSLAAVLREGRGQGETCWVGSVKTNIGHLESAAGIAGLIKVVLALVNETIPPHLQLRRLNSHIAVDGTPIQIPTTIQPWRRGNEKRFAGVSSFGFGGTNAHVIVEEGPAPGAQHREQPRSVEVLALSARTSSALLTLATTYAGFLRSNPEVSLADFAYTANVGRSHFPHRLALVAGTVDEAIAQLERHRGNTNAARAVKIAFLFTGQGAQYLEMGRQFFDSHAGFRETLERCDELLRGHLPKPLLEVLFGPGDGASEIHETRYAQPALFALEYALAGVWKQWGIVPNVVLGHSVGEFAAACFAGVFSLEDGLRMIAERARLMQSLPKTGSMLSVFADQQTCIQAARPHSESVSIAAVNGPAHVVLSGDSEALRQIEANLVGRGIGVKRLNVSHAFHSPLMKAMVDEFGRVAAGVEYRTATIDIISSVTGLKAGGEIAAPDYWRDQVLAPVCFSKAMESLSAMEIDAFLEIGPKPVLISLAKDCFDNSAHAWISSIEPDGQNYRSMFEALGSLYTLGASVNWSAVHDGSRRRRIPLPTYPFERHSYWLEEAAQAFAATTAAGADDHPLLGRRLGELAHQPGTHVWELQLEGLAAGLFDGHRLMGSTVAPYSAFVEMALAAASEVYPGRFHYLEDLSLHHPLFVSKDKPGVIQIVLNDLGDGNLSFKVFSRAQLVSSNQEWTLCSSAMIWATNGNEVYELWTDVLCQQ